MTKEEQNSSKENSRAPVVARSPPSSPLPPSLHFDASSADSKISMSTNTHTTTTSNDQHDCAVCENKAATRCSACKEVYFCSRECQALVRYLPILSIEHADPLASRFGRRTSGFAGKAVSLSLRSLKRRRNSSKRSSTTPLTSLSPTPFSRRG